jgi:multiple sugar transport system substrate-binding protein
MRARHLHSRRRFLSGITGAVAGALVVACGGQAATQPAATTAAPAKPAEAPKSEAQPAKPAGPAAAAPGSSAPVTLRFHARLGDKRFDHLIEDFNAKNPGITAKPEFFPVDQFVDKLNITIAGGTVGDAFWGSSIEHYFMYADLGALVPLDDRFKADKIDLGQFYKKVVDGMTFKGNLFGAPFATHPGRTGLFFHKKMFDDAKVAYPTDKWTYDDLLAAAQKLTKAGETFGLSFSPGYFAMIIPARAFGGDLIDAQGKQALISKPETVKGFQWVGDALLKHKVMPNSLVGLTGGEISDQQYKLMSSGKLAMIVSGYWGRQVVNYMKDPDKGAIGVVEAPVGPANSHGAMFEFDALMLTKASKFPAETWQFLKSGTSKEEGFIQVKIGFPPGARPDVWESPELAEDPLFRPWPTILKNAGPLHVASNHRNNDLALRSQPVLDTIWLGKQSVADGTAELNRLVQDILDQPKLTL